VQIRDGAIDGVTTTCSIFIASSVTIGSPAATAAPDLTDRRTARTSGDDSAAPPRIVWLDAARAARSHPAAGKADRCCDLDVGVDGIADPDAREDDGASTHRRC
jgi:hypothetical protein